MNKRLLGLIVALVIALGAFLFLRQQEQKSTTADYPARDMAVERVQDIHRIFIADMNGRSMNLNQKAGGAWLINDSLEAAPSLMQNVLTAVSKIRIDHVPPKTVVPVVLKEMRSTGLKVTTFDADGNQLKSIIIGPGTQDERNSYVVVEGYEEPFAVRVPGFSGSLRPLFDLRSVDSWRSKTFLREDPSDIQEVSVAFSRSPGESFMIERQTGELTLQPLSDVVASPAGELNPRRLEAYIEGMSTISLASRVTNQRTLDSLNAMVPFMQLKYKTVGENSRLDFHPILSLGFSGDPDPSLPIDKYYVVRDQKELVSIQTRTIQQLLVGYSSFFQ